MRTNPLFDFSRLSPAERIQLAQDLWDSLEPSEIDEECPVTEDQKAELDRRLDDLERNPETGIPWERARTDLDAKLGEVRKGRR